jgi:F0F1-type ATP synthase membrane subunit b/b'
VAIAAVSAYLGYLARKKIAEAKISVAEDAARHIIEDAEKEAEAKKREAIIEAKEEVHRMRSEFDRECRDRRNELQRMERRILQKEESLDRKSDQLEKKESQIDRREKEIDRTQAQIERLHDEQRQELERIAALTTDQARERLLRQAEEEITHEVAVMIKEAEARAREESERCAREIVTQAIQRCAADQVAEGTVSVVALPNDEMKGRIIGREGRNILRYLLRDSSLLIGTPPIKCASSGSLSHPAILSRSRSSSCRSTVHPNCCIYDPFFRYDSTSQRGSWIRLVAGMLLQETAPKVGRHHHYRMYDADTHSNM